MTTALRNSPRDNAILPVAVDGPNGISGCVFWEYGLAFTPLQASIHAQVFRSYTAGPVLLYCMQTLRSDIPEH